MTKMDNVFFFGIVSRLLVRPWTTTAKMMSSKFSSNENYNDRGDGIIWAFRLCSCNKQCNKFNCVIFESSFGCQMTTEQQHKNSIERASRKLLVVSYVRTMFVVISHHRGGGALAAFFVFLYFYRSISGFWCTQNVLFFTVVYYFSNYCVVASGILFASKSSLNISK